ncbi:hypothetical protein SLS58_006953 [Diplodia intermedia]|uniref:NACHT domain-containing protein n=1 Tax=Diplodia intermedia TaxID=856260 RepID=A0ABR3TMH6_9PEZI
MDPFAAVSFAGNILQFIEFATKLVKEGQEVYRSANGAVQEHVDLELITLDLKQLTDPLTSPRNPPKHASDYDKHLVELAAACQRTSDELLQILQALKLPKGPRNLKLDSIRVAFRTSRKGKQIDALQSRLNSFKTSLITHVLRQLSDQQSDIAKNVAEICNENRNLRIYTTNALDTTKSEIIDEIRQLKKQDGDHDPFMTALRMARFGDAGIRAPKEQAIIRSLHFTTIKVRFEEIKPAHASTFEWAFNDEKLHLRHWLEAEAGIFWVSGKAGSGKSTLMKFLCRQHETTTALQRWAEPKRVILASYFFWNAGYREQKSQAGLLRSLLFQIFQQAPELVSTVCPDRWNDINERENVWTLGELSRAFQALAQQTSLPVRLCFFVDGLDEFEPSVENGDHKDLVQILKKVSISPDIKLCLSTRPWPFVSNEISRSNRKVSMQDLTVNDMKTYVRTTLESNEDFKSLQMREPECIRLIAQIAAKAQGVFLWVCLVVRSLVRGLESHDTAMELQRRLEALPEGLEEFFERSIRSIEPAHRAQSARILQVAVTADEPLSVLAYHFLDVEVQNSNYAMGDMDPLEDDKDLYERMRRRLHARSKDLLEVNPLHDFGLRQTHVSFLHRTVKEFLEGSSDVAAMLRERTPGFDARISICKSFLALIKMMPGDISYQTYPQLVDDLLYYTREVEIHNRVAQIDVLEEVDRYLSQLEKESHCHWTNLRPVFDEQCREDGKCDFLGLAIQTGQRLYVEQKLSEDRSLLRSKIGRPYLDYALHPHLRTYSDLLHVPARSWDPDMVHTLLKLGANPNWPSRTSERLTPWVKALKLFQNSRHDFFFISLTGPDPPTTALINIIELLLKHGADRAVKLPRGGGKKKRRESATDVLRYVLPEEDARRILGPVPKYRLWTLHGLALEFSKFRKLLHLA